MITKGLGGKVDSQKSIKMKIRRKTHTREGMT